MSETKPEWAVRAEAVQKAIANSRRFLCGCIEAKPCPDHAFKGHFPAPEAK